MRLAAVIRSHDLTLRVVVRDDGWRVLGPDGHTIIRTDTGIEAMSFARAKLELEECQIFSATCTGNPYEVFDLLTNPSR